MLRDQDNILADEASDIQRLYESCTSRVSDIRLSLALAVLRGEDSPVVPEDFSAEPLATLVTRVLYRLRFQSEQKPFDSSSFALATPLLRQCIEKEGLGVEKGDTDAAMEQLALAIDVIAFHVRQCELSITLVSVRQTAGWSSLTHNCSGNLQSRTRPSHAFR